MGFGGLAALAAVHVIFAISTVSLTECDEVELLQAQVKQLGDSEIQLSATVRRHTPTAEEQEAAELAKKWQPLKDLAKFLAEIKYHCRLWGNEKCLPMLQEYRRKIWPRIENEVGRNLTMFEADGAQGIRNGWRPFLVKTVLKGCQKQPVVYMHVKEGRAKSVLANVEKYSVKDALKGGHLDDNRICKGNAEVRAFTFMRDPLERFTDAYGKILAYQGRHEANASASLLDGGEETSTDRARRFIELFLTGAGNNITGGLLPQSEYFAPIHHCTLRMGAQVFVGKSENKAKEWRRLIHEMGCDPEKMPFVYEKGTEKEAQELPESQRLFGLIQTSSSTKTAASAMARALLEDKAAYMRAFCWFSLPDYVMLDYDLPSECLEGDMGMIIDWAWTWKVAAPKQEKKKVPKKMMKMLKKHKHHKPGS